MEQGRDDDDIRDVEDGDGSEMMMIMMEEEGEEEEKGDGDEMKRWVTFERVSQQSLNLSLVKSFKTDALWK
ncbi:hypothetical protein TWF751_001781 [Orbilia oligospora]|nr:hypothetical protein TWF751_001781 [Orbilia oligospora]